ncbi:MAG TPA: PQQ-binding-like beta-propeller repeat protein [Burkholderiales bacterium]|nr:PQQ-binding-like beta-propeller repeat protein [Burkholderiales bacterium]
MRTILGHPVGTAVRGAMFLGIVSSLIALAGDAAYSADVQWPTFGGDYANTRFSPLTQINTHNVHTLEVKWTFSTQLPADPFVWFSTVPVIVGRTMYLTDPGNFTTPYQNVFAVDAKTGAQLWHRQLTLDVAPEDVGQMTQRSNRGVAVGRGKVYVGTQDARLWALDATTGEPVDSFGTAGNLQVGDVDAGRYLSAPPVFVPKSLLPSGGITSGHNLILIGVSGGENETRGYMSAFDADTGDLLWRFFTVPAPGERGGATWPAVSTGPFTDPFTRGGGAAWMPPAYDPDLGLVIFGTGNAGPDYDGTHRAGANLFTSSIVAVDVRNGRYVWHFQEVHHDLWDYDQAASPVLFDVEREGHRTVKAVGAAGKTGWFYILDRVTGSPVFPCPERKVSTATNVQAPDGTAESPFPTQPFCDSDAFVPQGGRTLSSGEYIAPIFTPPGLPTPNVFGPFLIPALEPYLGDVPVYNQRTEPGSIGGSDWTPTSFNAHLGLAFIGGNVLPMRYTSHPEASPTPGVGSLGGWISWTLDDQLLEAGTLTAMDVSLGKIRWQVITGAPAFGGTCATAGDLVFLGEVDTNPKDALVPLSYFSAYDARTGERLFRFRFPNDVPALVPCVSYSVDGEQFVSIAVGGLPPYKTKGNMIYTFGLPKAGVQHKEKDNH